jgi:hypothetical protein
MKKEINTVTLPFPKSYSFKIKDENFQVSRLHETVMNIERKAQKFVWEKYKPALQTFREKTKGKRAVNQEVTFKQTSKDIYVFKYESHGLCYNQVTPNSEEFYSLLSLKELPKINLKSLDRSTEHLIKERLAHSKRNEFLVLPEVCEELRDALRILHKYHHKKYKVLDLLSYWISQNIDIAKIKEEDMSALIQISVKNKDSSDSLYIYKIKPNLELESVLNPFTKTKQYRF